MAKKFSIPTIPKRPTVPKLPKDPNAPKNPGTNISSMIGSSKRLTLTYIVLAVWVGLAVFAVLNDADLYGLAVYFASGLPLILGYLWSETSRPTIKDASEIIKNIRDDNDRWDKWNRNGRDGRGVYDRDRNNRGGNINDNDNNVNVNIYPENPPEKDVSIYSNDASVELKINQSQLSTLMNIGYVNMVDNKYTFDKKLLEQIKALIDNNVPEPEI